MSMTTRETRTVLLIGGLGVVILWVYAVYLIAPLQRQAASLGQEVQAARDKLKILTTATANEATLKEQYQQVEQSVSSLRNLLPSEDEIPNVIALLTDLASQSQVKIQTIFPQRSNETLGFDAHSSPGKPGEAEPVVYKEIPIQIDALAGYHQLGVFLSLVESGQKPMRLSTLRITASPKESKRHYVKMVITAYFATNGAAEDARSNSYASKKF